MATTLPCQRKVGCQPASRRQTRCCWGARCWLGRSPRHQLGLLGLLAKINLEGVALLLLLSTGTLPRFLDNSDPPIDRWITDSLELASFCER